MISKDIVSKGPKRRDPACFQTRHDIIIPAGTLLRQDPGREGIFAAPVAQGIFSIKDMDAWAHVETYRKVVAA